MEGFAQKLSIYVYFVDFYIILRRKLREFVEISVIKQRQNMLKIWLVHSFLF